MTPMTKVQPFWEQPEQVEKFAAREADKRLLKLISRYPHPEETRVLDLGCAGGRNTEVLAKRKFDVYAVDASLPMVEKTRERVAAILGPEETEKRVRPGTMEDLQDFPENSFHLVVALGIYHNAQDQRQWDEAVQQTVRILTPGGQLLIANFSPKSAPNGRKLQPVPDKPHVYEGFSSGPLFLLEANEMDVEMAHHGLFPIVATETVKVLTEQGHRITVNALYRKQA